MTSYLTFYRALREAVEGRYPSTKELGDGADFERLASPHLIHLNKKIAAQAQAAIAAHYALATREGFRRHLSTDQDWLASAPLCTDAVLMAYDFHTTEDGGAFLVEVNTNASAFLVAEAMYRARGTEPGWQGVPALESLKAAFLAEAAAAPRGLALITDEDLPNQKMLIEFLMYRDLFRDWGWEAELAESSGFKFEGGILSHDGRPAGFIYNRLTDFYLADPRHGALREAWVAKRAAISPHPWAYHLFADKERLVEMSEPGWLEAAGASTAEAAALRAVLIPTFALREMGSAEEVWGNRKTLFFKPRRSYGAKSVYRGASVSRKVFERLLAEDTLVQTFVPPQSWQTSESDTHMENWKFDLRFYTYRDRIQLAVARSYQGQVTNFASRYGGLTAVEFV